MSSNNHHISAFDEDFGSYNNQQEKYHDAGYDSYVTGVCLARFVKYVGATAKNGNSPNWNSEFLLKCENKVFMMMSDYSFMNLAGEDEEPDRSNVFVIRDFPEKWKLSDITNRLKDLGSIKVKWIDSVSCLIIVAEKEKVALAISMTKSKNKHKDFRFEKWRSPHADEQISIKPSSKTPFTQQASEKAPPDSEGTINNKGALGDYVQPGLATESDGVKRKSNIPFFTFEFTLTTRTATNENI